MSVVPVIVPVPAVRSRTSIRYMAYNPQAGYYGLQPGYYGPQPRYYGRQRYYGHYPGNTYAYHGSSSVMLGPLPSDFLVVPSSDPVTSRIQQEENDHAMAAQMQMMNRTQQVVGRLQVTVVRASLHKNYGMTRMDPYVRLHFGQQVFETQTDINGAKNPVWNKTFYIYQLPKSFNSFHMEVYDERSLTDDERIAWVTVPILPTIMQGTASDQWYNLSGRVGDGMEGKIHIIMSYEVGPATNPPLMVYGGAGLPMATHYTTTTTTLPVYQTPQPPPPPPVTEADVKQVALMFPEMEEAVVQSVLESYSNNKEAAVEALLTMQQTT